MSRPETKGLKYFPFDVGFFGDKKIRLLRGEHGAEGVEIYQRLICSCYAENGYFLKWDNETDYALMADDTGYSIGKIQLIVSSCLKWSLFDDKLFKVGNVLTSRSIQRRYFIAISTTKAAAAKKGRHVSIEKDMCLLTEDDISEINKTVPWLEVTQNQGKSAINYDKSTINESKSTINPLNKTKENKTTTTAKAEPDRSPGSGKSVVVVEPFSTVGGSTPEGDMIKYFLNNISPAASKLLIDKLCSWLETFPPEVIKKAIDVAMMAGKRNMNYIEGTLRNWQSDGLTTLSLVEGHMQTWQDSKNKTNIHQSGDYPSVAEMIARGEI